MDDKTKIRKLSEQLAEVLEENEELRQELVAARGVAAEERHNHAMLRVEWDRVLGALPRDLDSTRVN